MSKNRLRALRIRRELTQTQVADLLGIDQRVYSIYETGKRDMPVRHLVKLSKLYGVSVDYLLGLSDEK
nr:helix-turn-helix transcriptional regulator [Maliibacterium massiliense]